MKPSILSLLVLVFAALTGCGTSTYSTTTYVSPLPVRPKFVDFGATYAPDPLIVGGAWTLSVPLTNSEAASKTIIVSLSGEWPGVVAAPLGSKSLTLAAGASGVLSFNMPIRYTPGNVWYLISIGAEAQYLLVPAFSPIAN